MPAINTGSTLPSLMGNATATENPSFRNPTPTELCGSGVLAPVPDGARVVEDLEIPIAILDRAVGHAAASERIDLVFVPSPERGAVAQHVAFEQWGMARDQAADES